MLSENMPPEKSVRIDRFRPVVLSTTLPQARDPRLHIVSDKDLSVFYAPFEHINNAARLVLVGITPGPTQMANALQALRSALLAGKSDEDALSVAKEYASFSGEPMRSNLISQLNDWGIHTWLRISDCAELFSAHSSLVHHTSLLRNPVFVGLTGYNGTPDMMRHPLLKSQVLGHFVPEMEKLNHALIIGLGPKVHTVLDQLARLGKLPRKQFVNGVLHPSGQNSYRIRYLVSETRGAPPHMTNAAPYDAGRAEFKQRFC